MASRASTPSDGEIVEAKATQSRSPSSSSVNRQSRRVLYSRSPSPTASTGPPRPRRSRSRSPYRERGSKRRHDDDHYKRRDRDDPRRFRAHYEDRRDRHTDATNGRAYEDRRRRHSRERRRSPLSRSPPRVKHSREEDRSHGKARSNGSSNMSGSVREHAGNKREVAGFAAASPQPTIETGASKVQHNASLGPLTLQSEVEAPPEPEQNVDVEALREAKRKKWEAIRAKHSSQPAPLLKQALHGNAEHVVAPSTPSPMTPATPAQAPSEISSAPDTPRSSSSRASTPAEVDFSNDSDLVNVQAQEHADVKAEEPSAADYDTTMDMEEDKRRHDFRLQNESSSFQQTATLSSPVRQGDFQQPSTKPKDLDMFADEDDEDDMFGPGPVASVNPSGPSTKALNVDTMDDWDDEEGYYKVILGELIDGRYHVQSNLGKGMFSAVVRAEDQVTGKLVAIKLIRSNETMRKAAAKEIGILENLKQADPEDRKHVIRLERSFEHKGHLCMVFENLHENLREVLKKFGRDVGIDLQAVRIYAQQIFKGLSLLRKCNILHADLKPDNILVNERRTLLKICDLGSAADVSESEITPYLVSRFYRAPEIILGMPYDYAIDTWSIGCTLFELYTGKILFSGRSNNQMLRTIMECRGRFSTKMLRKSEFAAMHFDEQGLFRSVERDRVTGKDIVRTLNFLKPERDLKARLMGTSRDPDLSSFLDLLDKCLTLNPERRINPNDAMKHPFLARKL